MQLRQLLLQQVSPRYLDLNVCEKNQLHVIEWLQMTGNSSYMQSVLKALIASLESHKLPIVDQVYESYSQLVMHPISADPFPTLVYGDIDSPHTIKLVEQPNTLSYDGSTGRRTWEAAIGLADYLITYHSSFNGLTLMELGAGTGLVGVVTSKLGLAKQVIITDGDQNVVQAIQNNIQLNDVDAISKQLVWGTPEAKELIDENSPCWIIAADVLYDPTSFPQLIATLKQAIPKVILSCTIRSQETWEEFENQCRKEGLRMVDLHRYPAGGGVYSMGFMAPETAEIRIVKLDGESVGHRT